MQAIFGKDYKGGIKLRSYCKKHSPSVNPENVLSSQADKIDASGVREIDMTNLADDKSQTGNEEFDYFWKYVDINEVHKNISEAYARCKRLKLASLNNCEIDDSSPSKKSSKKLKLSKTETPTKSKSPKKKSPSPQDVKPNLPMIGNFESCEVDPLKVDLIYRYWMLLRTANNGQSLIKFSPSALKEKEMEQRQSIMKLRIELERVRNLSYMIGKREKLKSAWLKTHQNIIKRTFGLISDLDPVPDEQTDSNDNSSLGNGGGYHSHVSNQHNHHLGAGIVWPASKKAFPPIQHQHLQTSNGMFDETDQLINDLITCDQIYEQPNKSNNSNYTHLSFQEQSTMERRRTLSLVRRINRQLKSVSIQPTQNPYAKNYLATKRNDSPVGLQQQNSASNKIIRSK